VGEQGRRKVGTFGQIKTGSELLAIMTGEGKTCGGHLASPFDLVLQYRWRKADAPARDVTLASQEGE
jgi:hypothetical protein